MRWGNPYAFWAFVFVPVLVLMYRYASVKRRKAMNDLGDIGLLSKLVSTAGPGRRGWKAALFTAAFTLIILALARPQIGAGLREIRSSGRDIVFALDVSKSMLAQDISPSRLAAAKARISGLLDNLEGDRAGLVVFAGEAFMQCPLTIDYRAMRILLDAVEPQNVPTPGTNIREAIVESGKVFKKADSRVKIVILLTDGEDHSGRAVEAAEEIAKDNIKIFTVGIGDASPSGAPIPIKKPAGGIEYKKDSGGQTIMTRLDEETLRKIALATSGKYHYAGKRLDLGKVYSKVKENEGEKTESRFYTEYEDRFQWLLLPALLILIIEAMLPERKKKDAVEGIIEQ